jgi:hypothetical protein
MLFDDCEIERSRETEVERACFGKRWVGIDEKKKRVCGLREKMYIGFP